MIGKGLVSVALPSRHNQGIVEIQIDTIVEYSIPSYKRAY